MKINHSKHNNYNILYIIYQYTNRYLWILHYIYNTNISEHRDINNEKNTTIVKYCNKIQIYYIKIAILIQYYTYQPKYL